jgi:hypothetical protein
LLKVVVGGEGGGEPKTQPFKVVEKVEEVIIKGYGADLCCGPVAWCAPVQEIRFGDGKGNMKGGADPGEGDPCSLKVADI